MPEENIVGDRWLLLIMAAQAADAYVATAQNLLFQVPSKNRLKGGLEKRFQSSSLTPQAR